MISLQHPAFRVRRSLALCRHANRDMLRTCRVMICHVVYQEFRLLLTWSREETDLTIYRESPPTKSGEVNFLEFGCLLAGTSYRTNLLTSAYIIQLARSPIRAATSSAAPQWRSGMWQPGAHFHKSCNFAPFFLSQGLGALVSSDSSMCGWQRGAARQHPFQIFVANVRLLPLHAALTQDEQGCHLGAA